MTTTFDYNKCPWCGLWHDSKCPLIKRMDYYPDGSIKSIEFIAGVISNESIVEISEQGLRDNSMQKG